MSHFKIISLVITSIFFCLNSFAQDPLTSLAETDGLAAGTYTFDFGDGPFEGYIDDEGWILWLQYHHKGGTNPPLNIIAPGSPLPVFDPSVLGTDNSGDLTKWGQGSQVFAQSIPDEDLWLRWQAETSGHSRVIHFESPVLGDFLEVSDENNNFLDISDLFLARPDHTALLPGSATGSYPTPSEDLVLNTDPFSGPGYWSVKSFGNYWEVDNSAGFTDSTIHRVWIKPNPYDDVVLGDIFDDLKAHILGDITLTTDQLNDYKDKIKFFGSDLENDATLIAKAIDVVRTFDITIDPLFIGASTWGGFNRDPIVAPGLELERVILCTQQILLDFAYNSEDLNAFPEVYTDFLFECSEIFPGSVDPPADDEDIELASVKCQFIRPWGTQPWYGINEDGTAHAIRPTGCYLAPGSIGVVEVPEDLVGKGYLIRVGAHSWDLDVKPIIRRMDRVSNVFPIDSTHITIANPLGGGVYIQVPVDSDDGIVEIKLKNVVRSPFYSHKSFDKTSNADWIAIEKNHPAPWADFESDKTFAQVPTFWIEDVNNPDSLMTEWDKAYDGMQDMLGRPRYSDHHHNYLQVDVIIRGFAYHPGYPMSNTPYYPWAPSVPDNPPFLSGPTGTFATHFHEIGHQVAISKFNGEVEALVNFILVACYNKGLDIDLDTAFSLSFSPNLNMFMDDAAETRMTAETFRAGETRNITGSVFNEVRYQHRGYAHYAEIVDMYGWCALENFWHSESIDAEDGIFYNINSPDQDDRILRMSKAAGTNLTPLFHFYGIHPEDPTALQASMDAEGLTASARIYDRLIEYQDLMPMNNAEFMAHALERHPGGLGDGTDPPEYGKGWYYVWSSIYDESHGEAGQAALNDIIELYFPDGPPPAELEGTICDPFMTPGKITGNVYASDGSPIENVEITLDDSDPETANPVLYTDYNGYYEFNEILEGEYLIIETQPELYVSISDYDNEVDGDLSDTIDVADNTIEVTLEPGEDDNQNNFVDHESAVSLDEYIDNNVLLYPVPAKNTLNIVLSNALLENDVVSIEIYSLLGALVYSSVENTNAIIQLDVSKLNANQMYLIKIKTDAQPSVHKTFMK